MATLIDLWYVSQTTEAVTRDDLTELRRWLDWSPAVVIYAVDVLVADETMSIPRDLLNDPWDRFIVATARALALPLVTRDDAIRAAGLVTTVW